MQLELGVNIDHVATVREARKTDAPDPIWAAVEAELGGADGITVHLREDRRHIQDRDVHLLRQTVHCKLNLEMSLADSIVQIACQVAPEQVTIVPERREEVTTEGGLDLLDHAARCAQAVARLKEAGCLVSAFIDPDPKQVAQAKALGFDAVELHTGAYANAEGAARAVELDRLVAAGKTAVDMDLRLHAGHGLNYHNTPAVARIMAMAELNIGHAIISRSLFVGLRQAVVEMKQLIASSLI